MLRDMGTLHRLPAPRDRRRHAPARSSRPAAKSPHPATVPERLWREALGEQIRSVRHARAERLRDVAERAGMAPQYLSEIERGTKDASSEMLAAVAGALGLRVLDLTTGAATRLARPSGGAPSSPVPSGPVRLAA